VVEKSPKMLAGWHNRAVEYRLKGRLDLAMHDMDRAVEHVKTRPHKDAPWPDPDLNPENASKVRGMRAKVALSIGDFGKAREDLRAVIDLFDQATNKDFVLTVLMDISNGFLDAKLYPDAIDAFTLIQQRVPNDPNVYMSRGKAFLQANFFPEALGDFDRMLSMNPNDGSAYFYRSMALGGLGQADRARADLNRACDLGFTAACNQIGRPVPVPGPR
jgi:tetratricopeptide (TPR) repeat protein